MRLARRVMDINPSITLKITSSAKKMKKDGIRVINFSAGEPDFDTPSHIKDAAMEAIRNGFTKYTPSSGTDELKIAICEKFKEDNCLNYDPEQIIVSNGAKHSLFNIFQALCDDSDDVIIPSPYWVSYPEIVRLAGANPKIVMTDQVHNFKLTKELFSAHLTPKTRAIILNSPSNPTGIMYTREELEIIADVAISNNVYVISDEIYEKITYDNNQHISIASLSKEIYDLTITVNGVSKSYAMTGWRIGYLGGPSNIVRAIDSLQSHSTSNPSSISQKAAIAALKGDQNYISIMVNEFKLRRNYMVDKLNSISGLSCIKPAGAFYVFCDVSGTGLDSFTFANRLLDEEKVALVPGESFGLNSHIRLSFATGMEDVREGLNRIEKFVSRLKNE